jgi:putative signal transducing protein
MREANLVVIHAFNTQAEADIAMSALESAEIDAILQADTGGGMRPHLAWSGAGFKLLVREEDAAAAREILEYSAPLE